MMDVTFEELEQILHGVYAQAFRFSGRYLERFFSILENYQIAVPRCAVSPIIGPGLPRFNNLAEEPVEEPAQEV